MLHIFFFMNGNFVNQKFYLAKRLYRKANATTEKQKAQTKQGTGPQNRKNKRMKLCNQQPRMNEKTVSVQGQFCLLQQNELDERTSKVGQDRDPRDKAESQLCCDIYIGGRFAIETTLVFISLQMNQMTARKERHHNILPLTVSSDSVQELKMSEIDRWRTQLTQNC